MNFEHLLLVVTMGVDDFDALPSPPYMMVAARPPSLSAKARASAVPRPSLLPQRQYSSGGLVTPVQGCGRSDKPIKPDHPYRANVFDIDFFRNTDAPVRRNTEPLVNGVFNQYRSAMSRDFLPAPDRYC
jgi:hypothetical protein